MEDGMNFYIFSDTQLALQTEQEAIPVLGPVWV